MVGSFSVTMVVFLELCSTRAATSADAVAVAEMQGLLAHYTGTRAVGVVHVHHVMWPSCSWQAFHSQHAITNNIQAWYMSKPANVSSCHLRAVVSWTRSLSAFVSCATLCIGRSRSTLSTPVVLGSAFPFWAIANFSTKRSARDC